MRFAWIFDGNRVVRIFDNAADAVLPSYQLERPLNERRLTLAQIPDGIDVKIGSRYDKNTGEFF